MERQANESKLRGSQSRSFNLDILDTKHHSKILEETEPICFDIKDTSVDLSELLYLAVIEEKIGDVGLSFTAEEDITEDWCFMEDIHNECGARRQPQIETEKVIQVTLFHSRIVRCWPLEPFF
jgi:hypothetical protein